jgi:hypothetical protein
VGHYNVSCQLKLQADDLKVWVRSTGFVLVRQLGSLVVRNTNTDMRKLEKLEKLEKLAEF